MDPDRWRRLESLFFAVLELPPEDRASFLDARCGTDDALRAEVEAVLASHDLAAAIAPDEPDGSAADTPDADRNVGRRLGPYRLEERIGRGGMGDVYRAQRVDEVYRQEVAVKLVRSHLLLDEMSSRFRLERQVLARLQHPNVAALLDGGVAEDGTPYLVMQYVQGIPITEYADAHRLTLAERLRLFTQVCRTVHFAHTNLVVHRDLKPSNILVTDRGEVRLLDFGIAKLLDPEGMGITAPVTEEHLLLTPEHAAPEQILGDPITTATDVYALGILLYELLTGTRPFRTALGGAWPRAVCEQEPEKPSAALTTLTSGPALRDGVEVARARGTRVAALRQQLRGDLDHITMMALRKEPERRYASAEQFAEDLERYLEGRPVLARRDTLGYRTRKFLRRNRLPVAAAALVVITLGASAVVSTRQAHARAIALAEAQAERDRAETLAGFMLGVFGANDPITSGGDTITARHLLDRAATRIGEDLQQQPETLAEMELAIGRAYRALGMFAEAQPHFESALQRRRATLPPEDLEIAEALAEVGRGLAALGDPQGAVPYLAQALAMRERLLGPRDTAVAAVLTDLARVEIELEEYARAQSRLERSVEILRGRGSIGRELPNALRYLYLAIQWQGDHQRALPYAAEALRMAEAGLSPTDPLRYHVAQDYGLALEGVELLDSAAAVHRRVAEGYANLVGPDHVDISYAYHNLGRVLRKQGRMAEALEAFQRGLEVRERALGPDHPAVAYLLHSYALARGMSGDLQGATELIDRAVVIAEERLGPTNISTLDALVLQSQLRALLGRHEEAIAIVQTLVERGWADGEAIEAPPYDETARDPRFQRLRDIVRQRAAAATPSD